MKNPVMYAIGYKHQEDVWVNFQTKEDDHNLGFFSFLPSEEMANDYIADVLDDDYVVIPVEIVSYRNGVTQFDYTEPKEWRYEDEDELE